MMTRRHVDVALGALCAFAIAGCGPVNRPPPPSGGGARDGGTVVDCPDEGRPEVTILTPAAAADPQSDPIVMTQVFTVECSPTSEESLIDPESVVIEVNQTLGAQGEEVTTIQTLDVSNRGDGVFEASVDASAFENGPISIVCTAEDVELPPRCGTVQNDTFLDLGPEITIVLPANNPSNQAGGMVVSYRLANDNVVDPDDPGAAISSHSLVVAGATIPTEAVGGGQFDADVDFNDTMLYTRPPDGPSQLSVRATNARGATRTVVYDINVDSQGPVINITAPMLAEIVGGGTIVRATITDPSGVNANTVQFAIDDEFFPMDPVVGSTEYEGTFDANEFDETTTAIVIEVFALDLVGNEGSASVDVKLDIVSPVIDLDPLMIREAREAEVGVECSEAFDPVGDDTINDGEVVGTVPEFRAWLQERTNTPFAPDGVVLNSAGIDDATVKLYILDDASQALVIDTDGNGTCDAINPAFLPGNTMGNDPVVVADFVPITPGGGSYFPATPAFSYAGATCQEIDDESADESPPDLICELSGSSLLTRVIPMLGFPSETPGIYGKAPDDVDRCVGDSWDLKGEDLTAGWFCVAMEASDNARNTNVSAPLRVCYVPDSGSLAACPAFPGSVVTPPAGFTCTDGCTGETIESVFAPEILWFP